MIARSKTTLISPLSAVTSTNAVNDATFGFYPDRDDVNFFSLRIPISIVSAKEPDVSERVARKPVSRIQIPDSINVKIKNDEGYICAEERNSHNLEISGLPCDQCMNSNLLVTIETKKGDKILSNMSALLSDQSRRAELCSLQPERRKEGEDLVVTSPKEELEDGCRWVFRDAGGSVGCCYSNRVSYTQSGGCDPRMQSLACRKGSEGPILVDEENSCILRISNLRPADSGNYLSKFKYSTPGFKKILRVEDDGEIPTLGIATIGLSSLLFLSVLTTTFLFVKRNAICSLVKENLMKMPNSEKFNTEPHDQLEILKPDHVA